MGILSLGSNSLINGCQLLKKKNLFLEWQVIFIRSQPSFAIAVLSREQKSQKWFPFMKMVDKHGGVPMHVKVNGYTSKCFCPFYKGEQFL